MSAPSPASVRSAEQVSSAVNETGRVLAQLDDWRAITFVLILVIAILLFERFWAYRTAAMERREMRDLAGSFAGSASKVADALADLRTEILVLRATASRVESTTGYQNALSTEGKSGVGR